MNRTLADIIKPNPGLAAVIAQESEMLSGNCAFCGKVFNTHLQYTHCSKECAELSKIAKNGMKV